MTKEDFNAVSTMTTAWLFQWKRKTRIKTKKHNGRYLRREFSYSKFQQTMILPENVDKDHISAQVENGVLNIELPKLSEEEVKKPDRTIEVK